MSKFLIGRRTTDIASGRVGDIHVITPAGHVFQVTANEGRSFIFLLDQEHNTYFKKEVDSCGLALKWIAEHEHATWPAPITFIGYWRVADMWYHVEGLVPTARYNEMRGTHFRDRG
jgi:hypothetical protein